MNDTDTGKTKKSLLRHGVSLSLLTLISRIMGLLREMTKSAFMGTSPLADAFAIAFLIPNLLRRLFAENSITVAFIPTFEKYLSELDAAHSDSEKEVAKKNAQEFLSAIFTLITFLTSIVVVIGIVITPLILKVFFADKTHDFLLTVVLTRIMFPYLALISLAALFQGILNSVKIFTPSGFTPILFNIIIIACTYGLTAFFDNSAIAMSVGVTAGGIVQVLFQLPFVLKTRFSFSFTSLKKAFTNDGTKRVVALIVPTLFGMAAYQLNDIVSSALGKQAGTGVLSSLQYSLRLQELLLGVFVVSVGTVILPDLSGCAAKKDWENFQKIFLTSIKTIALITIPATFFALISGEHIITLVYKAKHFDANSVALTLNAFIFHIGGLFFIALNRITAPAFYAQGNSKLPALAGLISFGVNIVLSLLLVNPMAGGGLALAVTIANFANTFLLFVFLKKNKNLYFKKIIAVTFFSVAKMCVFSFVAALPVYFFGGYFYRMFAGHGRIISEGIPLGINFCIFAAVGLFLLLVTCDAIFKNIIKRFIKR